VKRETEILDMEKKKYPKKIVLTTGTVIIAVAALVVCLITLNTAGQADADVLLREYPVSRGDITASIDGTGSLALDGAPHNFAFPIQLEELYVKRGETVKKGVKLAKASEAALVNKLDGLEEELLQAQINLSNAEYDKIAAGKAVKIARSSEKGAAKIKLKSCNNAVILAQMKVDALNLQIHKVKDMQDDPYIYAQMNGIVTETGYSVGAETTANTPVAMIGSISQLYAELQVAQTDIESIAEGQEVELVFGAYPARTFKGAVTKKLSVSGSGNNSVTYTVYVSFDREDAAFLPGMTCKASFIIKQVKDALKLSNKAIRLNGGKQFVLLKDERGSLYEQEVKTGFSDGKFSEILSGVKEGDTVYVEG
jgi:RND family efflux transporter MFP subunit